MYENYYRTLLDFRSILGIAWGMFRDLLALGIGGTITIAVFCYVVDDLVAGFRTWWNHKR